MSICQSDDWPTYTKVLLKSRAHHFMSTFMEAPKIVLVDVRACSWYREHTRIATGTSAMYEWVTCQEVFKVVGPGNDVAIGLAKVGAWPPVAGDA